MNKLIICTKVLCFLLVCNVSASVVGNLDPLPTISLTEPEKGEPGSLSNPLHPGERITISVQTTDPLISFDTNIKIEQGTANIVNWTTLQEGVQRFGWDPAFSLEPGAHTIGQDIFFAAGHFNGLDGIMAEIVLECEGPEDVILNIGHYLPPRWPEYSFGDPITIYQVPEPISVVMMGMGLLLIRRKKNNGTYNDWYHERF